VRDIVLHEGDDVMATARSFCLLHGVGEAHVSTLAAGLQTQYDSALAKARRLRKLGDQLAK
jgi:hypothetical protein